MLVSKWTRLWTSSCHLMASRLETRLSKGYWWVRLPRCQARTIGSTNYYVSCGHSWADPHPHYFTLVILFLNYAKRVIIVIRCTLKKMGLIFLIGMTILYHSIRIKQWFIKKKKWVFFPININFFYFSVKRLLDFLRQIISSQHKEPLKVPPGFSAVERELSQLCGRFLRLISYNRSVFGSFYTDIINTLLQKHMADLSPR